MENIILIFIIVVIALVSVARKIASKQTTKQGDGTPAAVGWASKLNTFINDIQQRVEAQQPQESPTDANQWRELMEEDAPSRRQQMAMDDLIMEDEFDIDDHPEVRTSKRRPEAEPMPSPQPPSVPAMPPAKAKADLRIPLLGSTMGGANLRRAVIWSEILGPPVALKKPGGDRF